VKRFELYSDASFDVDTRVGAWCYFLLRNDQIHAQNTGWERLKNTFYAELAGLHAGIIATPKHSKVLIHTDIRALGEIFDKGFKSKHAPIKNVLSLVRQKELEIEISFERRRQDRSEWYWLCDKRSNLLMKANIGRGGANLGVRR
jgi:ribonuclease HI